MSLAEWEGDPQEECRRVKWVIKRQKRKLNKQWGRMISDNFKGKQGVLDGIE